MAGYNVEFQNQTSAGPMRIEFGRGDATVLSAQDGSFTGVESVGVVSNFTHIAGGWMTCSSVAALFHMGCMTSQTVTEHSYGWGWVDFTMDESTEVAESQWIIFGW
jgi:hypothetical protein